MEWPIVWISLITPPFWGLKCSSVLCMSYKFVVESQDFIRFRSEFVFAWQHHFKCGYVFFHQPALHLFFLLCLIPCPFFLYWGYIPSTQAFMLLPYRHVSINSLLYITITAYLWYHKCTIFYVWYRNLLFPLSFFSSSIRTFSYFIHFNRHLVSQNTKTLCFQFS